MFRDIIDRLREIQVSKVYLMADYGRNKNEIEQAEACRKAAEQAIDWNCEVIKNYATENRGVYGNIGKGAQWVFQREEMAIFLEDDNLPEVTFFRYCDFINIVITNKYCGFVELIIWVNIILEMEILICLPSICFLAVGHHGLLNL